MPLPPRLVVAAATVLLTAAAPPAPSALDTVRAEFTRDPAARIAEAHADLNGDGVDEVLAYVTGPRVCGSGGCALVVLTRRGAGWSMVARTSVTRLPVRVLPMTHRGWHDLAVAVGGGGLGPAMARLAFDGVRYPANPTLTPTTRRVGRTVIAASTTTRALYR